MSISIFFKYLSRGGQAECNKIYLARSVVEAGHQCRVIRDDHELGPGVGPWTSTNERRARIVLTIWAHLWGRPPRQPGRLWPPPGHNWSWQSPCHPAPGAARYTRGAGWPPADVCSLDDVGTRPQAFGNLCSFTTRNLTWPNGCFQLANFCSKRFFCW